MNTKSNISFDTENKYISSEEYKKYPRRLINEKNTSEDYILLNNIGKI